MPQRQKNYGLNYTLTWNDIVLHPIFDTEGTLMILMRLTV